MRPISLFPEAIWMKWSFCSTSTERKSRPKRLLSDVPWIMTNSHNGRKHIFLFRKPRHRRSKVKYERKEYGRPHYHKCPKCATCFSLGHSQAHKHAKNADIHDVNEKYFGEKCKRFSGISRRSCEVVGGGRISYVIVESVDKRYSLWRTRDLFWFAEVHTRGVCAGRWKLCVWG